jgi:hypothetical protein
MSKRTKRRRQSERNLVIVGKVLSLSDGYEGLGASQRGCGMCSSSRQFSVIRCVPTRDRMRFGLFQRDGFSELIGKMGSFFGSVDCERMWKWRVGHFRTGRGTSMTRLSSLLSWPFAIARSVLACNDVHQVFQRLPRIRVCPAHRPSVPLRLGSAASTRFPPIGDFDAHPEHQWQR